MRLRSLVLFTALLSSASLSSSAEKLAENINSAYRIQGDRAIAPVQVFDNGKNTYLQLRDPRYPPAVLLEDGTIVSFASQPPYLVLTGVYDSIVLRYGNHLATIRSRASLQKPQGAPAGGGQNVWYGLASPDRLDGKAKEPVPATSITAVAPVAPVAPVASVASVVPVAPLVMAIKPQETPAPSFTGSFMIEKGAGDDLIVADKKSVSQPSRQIATIVFPAYVFKMTASDIVQLSDFIGQAGQGKSVVIRGGQNSVDAKRIKEVKKQLTRLGVNPGFVRAETSPDLSKKVEIFGGENGQTVK